MTDRTDDGTVPLPPHVDPDDVVAPSYLTAIRTAVRHPDWSQQQIADELSGIPRSTVSDILQRNSIAHQSRQDWSAEEIDEVRDLGQAYPYAILTALKRQADISDKRVKPALASTLPSHPALHRTSQTVGKIAHAVREEGGTSLRPYETTSLTPEDLEEPTGLTGDDLVVSDWTNDDATTDAASGTEIPLAQQTLTDDGYAPLSHGETYQGATATETETKTGRSQEQTAAEERLEKIREQTRAIAQFADGDVKQLAEEIHGLAGGDDSR